MKKPPKQKVALALTWDGARFPVKGLSPKARAFLKVGVAGKPAPSAKAMSGLLAGDQISEVRICWVPRLKGGDDVLALPFVTSDGKRVSFRAAKTVPLGDMIGVVYRRS